MSAKSIEDKGLLVTEHELHASPDVVSPNTRLDSNALPARKRGLSERGEKYFLDIGLKNRNKSHSKALTLIKNVEELMRIDGFEEVCEKIKTLVEVHKEFQCSHLRYQELARQANVPEEEPSLGEEVSQSVSECIAQFHGKRFERRQLLFEDIKRFIQTAETHILNSNLMEADQNQVEIEKLFAEFMTYDPQCYPDQGDLVDIDKEREFTHQVDDAVFGVRKRLADAKAAHDRPSSGSDISRKSDIRSKPPSHCSHGKPPLSRKSGSKRSHKPASD